MLSSREILRDDVKPHFSSLFRPLVLLPIDFSCLNDYSDACQMVIFLIPSSHLHLLVGFRICKGDFFSPFLFIPSFIYLCQCRFRFLFDSVGCPLFMLLFISKLNISHIWESLLADSGSFLTFPCNFWALVKFLAQLDVPDSSFSFPSSVL